MVLSKERLTQDGVWLWSQHSDLGVPDQLWVCRLVHLVLGAVAWPLDRIKSHGRQLKRLCAPLSQFSSEMNKGMCAHELRLAKNCFHHFYIKATIRQKINKQIKNKFFIADISEAHRDWTVESPCIAACSQSAALLTLKGAEYHLRNVVMIVLAPWASESVWGTPGCSGCTLGITAPL